MYSELGILLGAVPPWVLASLLLGVACGALVFVILGRKLVSLPLYVIVGGAAGVLGQTASLGVDLQPWPFEFGQVHPAAVAGSAMLLLFVARLYRL